VRAMRADKFRAYEGLKLVELPKPTVSDGKVLLRMTAAGFQAGRTIARSKRRYSFESALNAAITISGIELAHRIRQGQFSFGPGTWPRSCSLKRLDGHNPVTRRCDFCDGRIRSGGCGHHWRRYH
jgi:hypothetical protein